MSNESVKGCVYLIHMESKIHHAHHYIGFSARGKLKLRINEHRKNRGCKLLRAANLRDIPWRVVRIWRNVDGNFERKLKNSKNAPKQFCPICREARKNDSHC